MSILSDPTNIGEATRLIKAQNPSLSFEESWRRAEALHPELVTSSTAESSRIQAKLRPQLDREKWKVEARIEAKARQLMSRNPRLCYGEALRNARGEAVVTSSTDKPLTTTDPRIAEQMRKMKALEDDKTSAGIERHAKFLSEVRKLMSRDTSLTHDAAMVRVFREHPELWPGGVATARHAGPIGATLVKCHLAVPLDGQLPTRIMFMPAGKTTICPSVNGSPKQISVNVTRQTANAFQTDLDKLLSRTVKPYIDFNHSGNEAAALPKRFVWVEGQGIFLDLDWTAAGRSAVSGRNWNYFSPTFLINQDGDPFALPETGSIGGLTNSPAFRDMKGITATRV
jgi:hypothetical protein